MAPGDKAGTVTRQEDPMSQQNASVQTPAYGIVGCKSITPRRRCGIRSVQPFELRAADDGGVVTLHDRPHALRYAVRVIARTTSSGRAPLWMQEAVRMLSAGAPEDGIEAAAKSAVRRAAARRPRRYGW